MTLNRIKPYDKNRSKKGIRGITLFIRGTIKIMYKFMLMSCLVVALAGATVAFMVHDYTSGVVATLGAFLILLAIFVE